MSQTNEKCKAITKSGTQCSLPPGPSGYCHIHDPEIIAANKASLEEAERRVKTKIEEENRHRTEQLEQMYKVISVLGDKLQHYREKRNKHQLLESVTDGLYVEIEKLTKKAPAEQVTDLALEQINDVIRDTKELIENDPYIQKLEVFVPAGDLPQLRDVLIVLRQVKQGLNRVSNSWETGFIIKKLEEARIVKLALEYALKGENDVSILQRIKNKASTLFSTFPTEWEIRGDYNRENSFNFKHLDSVEIQEYFKVE